MGKGKLIVIDGLDASGKQTQVSRIQMLLANKYGLVYDNDFTTVSFPRYGHDSAHMVESYLNGKLGLDAESINPYLASMFYAIDRGISFQTEEWGEIYRNGGLVIADRYYTSNFIHQGSKIIAPYEREYKGINQGILGEYYALAAFMQTIKNQETFAGIPVPNHIIFLTTSEEANKKHLEERSIKENRAKDIHEDNNEYMQLCRRTLDIYKNYVENSEEKDVSGNYSNNLDIPHTFIEVSDGADYRPVDDITEDIMKIIKGYIPIKKG